MRAKIALFVCVGLLQGLLPARTAQAGSAADDAEAMNAQGSVPIPSGQTATTLTDFCLTGITFTK